MPEASAKQRLIANIRKKALRAAKASSEARVQLEEVADSLVDEEQEEEQEEEQPRKKKTAEEVEEEEGAEVDPESVPYKDWLNLAGLVGVPVSSLKARRGLDPYSCTIAVERVKPNIYKGKRVPTGLIPGVRFTFPFNLTQIEQELASLYGGEQYNLRLRDNYGKTLRTIPLTIAMPPKNLDVEEEEGNAVEDSGPVSDLQQKVREEELTTELLRRRRQRLEAQQEVEELEPGEEGEEQTAPSEFDISQEVERRVQAVREELVQEYEVKAELKSIRDEIRNSRKSDDGGGNMNLIVTAMQTQTNAMLEGLKMVVQNVADQVKEMQRSSQTQAEVMSRAQSVASEAQAKVMQAMMEAKGGQVELVMKLLGDKREREDMTIDRITNLIMTGMELKAGLAGKEGGGDDWLNVAIKSLTDLITKKTMADTSIPALPPPSDGAPAIDADTQRRIIEAEAQKAAAKIVAKAKRDALARAAAAKAAAAQGAPPPAQSGAPAQPATAAAPAATPAPAPSVGDVVEVEEDEEEGDTMEVEDSPVSADPVARRRALMSQILTVVLQEMDDMPLESEVIDFALTSMPADWREKIAATDNALVLAEFFKPFADLSLVEKITTKAKSNPAQKDWLMRQAGILRGAVVEAMQEEKQAQQPQGGAS